MTVLNAVKHALEILYPLRCCGCGAHGFVLCRECVESLRAVDQASTCPVCGRWIGKRIMCGDCILEKRGFHEGYYGFYFEDRLRDALHAFKFQNRKDMGKYLINLIKERIIPLSEKCDVIIPIPVTEKRLRERGFNQSFIISEEISRITGRPVYPSVLRKAKETKDQYSLSKEERRKNIKGAFMVQEGTSIKEKSILLVDDLFTTGYTAQEASRVLLKEKPRQVTVFALARTPS